MSDAQVTRTGVEVLASDNPFAQVTRLSVSALVFTGTAAEVTRMSPNVLAGDTAIGPDAPPSNAVAVLESGDVTLTWDDNSSDEQAFDIYRKAGNGPYLRHAQVGADVTLYVDVGVTEGVQYTYRVAGLLYGSRSTFATSNTVGGSGGGNRIGGDGAIRRSAASRGRGPGGRAGGGGAGGGGRGPRSNDGGNPGMPPSGPPGGGGGSSGGGSGGGSGGSGGSNGGPGAPPPAEPSRDWKPITDWEDLPNVGGD